MTTTKQLPSVPTSPFSNEELGKTIRLIRTCAGVTQIDFGKVLGLQQAAISRIESGSQYLTPEQLYVIAHFFGTSIDSVIDGTVDYCAVATKFGRKPPLPPRYQELPFSKLREALPFILSVDAGPILGEMKINPAQVKSPDQAIGVHFLLDLLKKGIKDKTIRKQNLKDFTDRARSKQVQGFLHAIYLEQEAPLNLVQSWILNSHHYDNNFSYEIQKASKEQLELTIKPHTHMKGVPYHDETLGDFLCEYKKLYFCELPRYVNLNPLKLEERECHYHGGSQCVYTLTSA